MCACDEPKGEARLAVPGAPQFDMADKTEPIALSLKPNAGLNQEILLPRGIAAAEGIKRTLYISDANQEVPTSVRNWMIADPRYNGWFIGESITPSLVGAAAVVSSVDGQPLSGAVIPPVENPAAVTPITPPDGGQQTPPQTPPPEGETWNESDNVPVLREYAKKFGVELKSTDNKADVVAKLREARGAFEVKDPEPPKE